MWRIILKSGGEAYVKIFDDYIFRLLTNIRSLFHISLDYFATSCIYFLQISIHHLGTYESFTKHNHVYERKENPGKGEGREA